MVYKVKYKTYNDFLRALESREWKLIERVTSTLLSAMRKNKEEVQVFEVETEEGDQDFIIKSSEYIHIIKNCLEEYINRELYEQCAEMKKVIDSYEKKIKI